MKSQNENLKKEKEDLQTQLDFISSQMQNLAEQEYRKRRKQDAEVIASYQQYCGVSPDKIEKAGNKKKTITLCKIMIHTRFETVV
ncbi:MAG: hypothetical protein K2G25_08700 [Oscillospiraceae bacterium]|nr:hypothetical protein [Oscillospiraceae bacterium]